MLTRIYRSLDAPESICYAHLNVGNASSVSDLVYGSALPDMKACRPFGRISKKADATAEMADLIYYTLTELEKVCLRGSAQSSNRLSISAGGSPYGIEVRVASRTLPWTAAAQPRSLAECYVQDQ
ncbi:hypothetical protein BD311DRAFT_777547 [Dichomitus squalens]|uniref:Uncharacterized protein n=1 Tax=Dichomitus squalens TaxID=114155 RepID=A0A4Q9MNU6_9APHY|nr:hypothetical protein BD311DRAFT_777547 [Dichomitus squalens]